MRRFLILIAVILLACRALTPTGDVHPTFTPSLTPTVEITSEESPSPEATLEARGTVPSDSTPSPAPPSALDYREAISYTVILHPDGGLYAGDLVSIEVVAPPGTDLEGSKVTVQVEPPEGEKLETAKFGSYGIGERQQATLTWAWDTHGLPPGAYELSFSILPAGPTWVETVLLQPQSEIPPPEPEARWATAQSGCCVIHYITGSAAERDLPALIQDANRQAERAASHFSIDFTEPVTITLVPRLLGHGGFASNEINVSYLDRNYAASQFGMVLHHEMVHILDSRLGGELRPSMLVEGLAVYLTGGHFKPEPLLPRAAALLKLPSPSPGDDQGWYLPLLPLVDNFYPSQHEIGYLEAGALIEYMVKRWGWVEFSQFYRDIHPHESKSQARAVDQALQNHFAISFEGLEQDFLETLRNQEVTPDLVDDVRLSVLFFDTVRRYQQLLDPSAYFQTAWLLDNEQMRQRGIVADYLRHPTGPLNVALETLLVSAGDYIRRGDFTEAQKILTAVNGELDEIQRDPVKDELQEGSFVLVWNTSSNTAARWGSFDGFKPSVLLPSR